MNETPDQNEPQIEAVAEPVAAERTVADVEAELAQVKDQMLRALAETENARRRAEREAAEGRVYAIDRFARDLLAVADNLGRALLAMSPEQRAAADESLKTVIDGVEMTERALIEIFGRHGLKRVGARGDKFDPNVHQAVAQIPSDAPAGAIADVFQPGYVLGDRTLRAAMVAVSLGSAANESPPPAEGGGSVDIKV
ncbi:MAG: nucleotide exchange factor GrpE [Alphaproteobacteria bacterium]|nr:nucleotide exchange factor GrpE [Alphaproteobacteria bacterium]